MIPGWLETTEAALNAVLGDYLERRGNGLAIEMELYHRNAPLPLSGPSLRQAHPKMSSRIVVLVHGMAQTEACWSFPGEPMSSYGALLEQDVGLTPLLVRYNTGRHISDNGRDLAALLERLVEASPVRIEDITLIGHSMGGLVIRSACYYAETLAHSWIHRTHRAFYLGSPHLGAPYEKAGHLVSVVLGAIDNPVVRLTRGIANLRSAGVKDLRHGSLRDEDWPADDLDLLCAGPVPTLPLLEGMDHYFLAGTLTQRETHVVACLFGDALVRLPSATDPGRRAGLPAEHFAVFAGLHHMDLAHSPEVYAKIRDWIAPASIEGPAASTSTAAHVDETTSPTVAPMARRDIERLEAYRALLQDAVDEGATAVQRVQEELTARPYDWIERVPPLEMPTKIVRTAHFAAIHAAYDATRLVNRAVGAALREGIAWMKRR
jgi:pimeloyl-ACP methyl ester carboxylesterase